MNEPLRQVGAVTLFVEDVRRSRSFYEETFDVPVIYEDDDSVVFRFENMLVNVLQETAARELIDPAPVGPRESGARFQFTIWVDDANAASARLSARGVTLLNGPVDREWGMRTAAFADPDGHVWEIAQRLE